MRKKVANSTINEGVIDENKVQNKIVQGSSADVVDIGDDDVADEVVPFVVDAVIHIHAAVKPLLEFEWN